MVIHRKKAPFSYFIFSFFISLPIAIGISFLIFSSSCSAQPLSQKSTFTRQDTLRGSMTPERAWWDVMKYTIRVEPDYTDKTITGINHIMFKVLKAGSRMQIDLQQPMQIEIVKWKNQDLPFGRDGNVYYIEFPEKLAAGNVEIIQLHFAGKPREAVNPPWDGGWIWEKDKQGRPWMSVACQGLGASVWYPCKDYQGDEPDSGAILDIVIPDTLMAVGNGRLTGQWHDDRRKKVTYRWQVENPINNYNIIPYIGKYVSWKDIFNGEKGPLDCSYWVLDYDLEKAKEQFKQVPQMLQCFEHWFGPYPFYEDGYKLVQSPHLGMEHQSAVAYGNKFQNGYLGRDLSGSGWGKKWDFIIIHESGHEWFANSITSNDIADMWLHEGFTNYSETIFTTCLFGVEAGNDYCTGSRRLTENDIPIIGKYGVNHEGSGDMYYKGGNLVHMIRQIMNDDEKFRMMLRSMNKDFYHKTVDSKEVEAYISKKVGKDLSKMFDQYLRTTDIPVLEYKTEGHNLQYRWTNCVKGFNMPLKVHLKGERWITPSEKWQKLSLYPEGDNTFKADRNFYIETKRVK